MKTNKKELKKIIQEEVGRYIRENDVEASSERRNNVYGLVKSAIINIIKQNPDQWPVVYDFCENFYKHHSEWLEDAGFSFDDDGKLIPPR